MFGISFHISLFAQNPVYVNVEANDSNTGISWEDAVNSIQEGVNLAVIRDKVVWVAKGVYYEHLTLNYGVGIYGGFAGIEMSLNQRNVKGNETIIDGKNNGRVILCLKNNIVDGFTIRNGYAVEGAGQGSAIFGNGATVIIRNNLIYGNYQSRGAIYIQNSYNSLIEYNIVTHNHGTVCAGGIEFNYAHAIGRHNTVVDNIGFGIEIPHRDDPPQILGEFYNNIVVGNIFNEHPRFLEPVPDNDLYQMAKACTDYSFIGKIWSYSYLWGSPFDHPTNIYGDYHNVEPGFVDQENWDYHLRADSPCRNSGKNNADMGALPYSNNNSILISGYVRNFDGDGISGVTICFNNGGGTTTTSSDGYYSKTVMAEWSGVVTPTKSGFNFSPSSRSYSNVTSNKSDQNYTGEPQTFLFSGYVRTSGESGINGVTMNFSNEAGTTTTNNDGYYSKTVNYGWSGTVTPNKTDYIFNPANRSYNNITTNQNDQNYIGDLVKYTISGLISYYSNNSLVKNVNMRTNGVNLGNTNQLGQYNISLEMGNNYEIFPSKIPFEDIGNYTVLTYDAAITARFALGLQSLSNDQQIAADADLDNNVLVYDAALIARYAVGLGNISNSHVGEWIFNPEMRSYLNLQENIFNENYKSYILGDVDGNWDSQVLLGKKEFKVVMTGRLQKDVYIKLDTLYCPFYIEQNINLISFDLEIEHDQKAYKFIGIEKSALARSLEFVSNLDKGRIKIGAYGINPINRGGKLFVVKLLITDEKGSSNRIELKRFQINYGDIEKSSFQLERENQINNPNIFKVISNYPNPFNSSTNIRFYIPDEGNVKIIVFNQRGSIVNILLDDQLQSGYHSYIWKGKSSEGFSVSSGIYFLNIRYKQNNRTLKVMLLR